MVVEEISAGDVNEPFRKLIALSLASAAVGAELLLYNSETEAQGTKIKLICIIRPAVFEL